MRIEGANLWFFSQSHEEIEAKGVGSFILSSSDAICRFYFQVNTWWLHRKLAHSKRHLISWNAKIRYVVVFRHEICFLQLRKPKFPFQYNVSLWSTSSLYGHVLTKPFVCLFVLKLFLAAIEAYVSRPCDC